MTINTRFVLAGQSVSAVDALEVGRQAGGAAHSGWLLVGAVGVQTWPTCSAA
jgi:hypothetical protein